MLPNDLPNKEFPSFQLSTPSVTLLSPSYSVTSRSSFSRTLRRFLVSNFLAEPHGLLIHRLLHSRLMALRSKLCLRLLSRNNRFSFSPADLNQKKIHYQDRDLSRLLLHHPRRHCELRSPSSPSFVLSHPVRISFSLGLPTCRCCAGLRFSCRAG